MKTDEDLKIINNEGYYDPTAYNSIRRAEPKPREDKSRINKVVRAIKFTAHKFGFSVTSVKLYDKHTGKSYNEF